MEKGLLWLPLLAVFIGLAWAGRREFQKIEAYRLWSHSFSKAKYDIYSVLGLSEGVLVWGKPTPGGIVQEQKIEIKRIMGVNLMSNGKIINVDQPDLSGSGDVVLELEDSTQTVTIPFTEISLAAEWVRELREEEPD